MEKVTQPAERAPGARQPQAPAPALTSELALLISFLMILAVVPVTQTLVELARHERVQFTDVFRYRPTAKNLRQYEATLKEKSWFQQTLRPQVQRLLFAMFRDTGAKGLPGRDRWVFYRPDVRYLVEPDRPESDRSDSKWVTPDGGSTQRDSVLRAIVQFRDQLKGRGITLLIMPVPGKPSIYPDELGRFRQPFRSPTLDLIRALESQGVAAVDLFAVFGAARGSATNALPLYLAQDTHWTPLGARLAAEAVAGRLGLMQLAPPASKEFQVRPIPVNRWGDVLEMMQIPGLHSAFSVQQVSCEQVVDPALGPLLPTASDRPGTYRYPGQKSAVLVLGDSFCRIYQFPEPQTLGELRPAEAAAAGKPGPEPGAKRLLPGSAGFCSHLALALKAPVDVICSDGGASTDVRRKLSTNPEILEGKKVVIWEFVERDIALGREGWSAVPLPAKLD